MSDRTTAEIVADLRLIVATMDTPDDGDLATETADRLAELNASNKEIIADCNRCLGELRAIKALRSPNAAVDGLTTALDGALNELADVKTARPPCPTCGGTAQVLNDDVCNNPNCSDMGACPDCIDGKVSIDQLVATYNAVWNDDHPAWSYAAKWTRDELRSVRPSTEVVA